MTATPKADRSIVIADGNGGTEKYSLLQFHFHTLSEHKVDGKHYDMEMHLVHANDAFIAKKDGGKLAVLGVFIKAGAENEVLKGVFSKLPHGNDHATKNAAEVNADYKSLLPAGDLNVYTYQGSLTTPGCNEIVSWFVFDKPIEMSQEQIDAYRHLYVDDKSGKAYNTNRPVQSLNGRTVSYGPVK